VNWSYGNIVVSATQPNSTLTITFDASASEGLSGMQLVKLNEPSPTGALYCFGDGSSAVCPCNNAGIVGRGCANILSPIGARLTAAGTASVSSDTLVLRAISMSGAMAWFLQGTEQALNPFGYGLLCVGGSVIRVGQKPLINGSASYPAALDPRISAKGAIPPSGGKRHYQVSYRQANPPCTPAPSTNSNRTNGLTVVWTP
jgi:hypothetical protein